MKLKKFLKEQVTGMTEDEQRLYDDEKARYRKELRTDDIKKKARQDARKGKTNIVKEIKKLW